MLQLMVHIRLIALQRQSELACPRTQSKVPLRPTALLGREGREFVR